MCLRAQGRRYSSPAARSALPADAALLAAVALAPTFALSLASLLLWQAANMLVILNGISVRQLVTPDHLQGRVNTTARMIAWGGTPFGAAVGGALAEGIGIRGALLLTAITVMLSAVLAWFSPLREPSLEAEPIPL